MVLSMKIFFFKLENGGPKSVRTEEQMLEYKPSLSLRKTMEVWSASNPHQIREVTLHPIKVCV